MLPCLVLSDAPTVCCWRRGLNEVELGTGDGYELSG